MLRKDEEIDEEASDQLSLPLEVVLHVVDFGQDLGSSCTFFQNEVSRKKRALQEQIMTTYVGSGSLTSTNFPILDLLPTLISETIKQPYDTNPHDPKHYNKRLNYLGLLATLMHEVIYLLEKENGYRYAVCVDEKPRNYLFALSSFAPCFKLLNKADVETVKVRHATSFSILKNKRELAHEEFGGETLLDIMKAVDKSIRYLSLTKEENTPYRRCTSFFWREEIDPYYSHKKILNHCISLLVTSFNVLKNEINNTAAPVPVLPIF